MAEKLFDAQVNYGWGLSLNMTGKAPAVAKRIFDTYNDALAYVNDVNDSAVEGLVLSVVADSDATKNGIYFVSKVATADEQGSLVAVGSDVAAELGDVAADVETIKNVLNGEGEEAGLISRVESLEGIDHTKFVEKEEGKGLSTNDYTDEEKQQLASLVAFDHTQYENKIETITVNGGDALAITDKNVDITIEAPVYNSSIETEEVEGVVTVKDGDNAPTTKAVYDYVGTVKSVVDNVVSTLEDKVNAIETWKLQLVAADENGYPVVPPNESGLVEISHKTIYLVPTTASIPASEASNHYAEFIYLDTGSDKYWEKLGEFKADFDPTGLQDAIDDLNEASTDYSNRIGALETKLANYETLVSDVETLKTDVNDLKTAVNDPESGLAKVKEIADGAAEKAGANETAIGNLQTTVGDDASGLVKDVNYLKDTVEGIVSVGGEANLVNDVTVDGVSIVADKVAVLNTAASKVIDGETGDTITEAIGGLMSAADKEKLDGISTMTSDDIDVIIGVTKS